MRPIGQLIAYRNLSTTWQLALGATYLGRYDYPVLPVAGVIWAPDDRTCVKLVFPSPRFERRLVLPHQAEQFLAPAPLAGRLGLSPQDRALWYLRGDLGGNTYAIRRADGRSDMVTIRDFRFAIGYERRGLLGFVSRSEIGIAFGRDLKYSSDPHSLHLDRLAHVPLGVRVLTLGTKWLSSPVVSLLPSAGHHCVVFRADPWWACILTLPISHGKPEAPVSFLDALFTANERRLLTGPRRAFDAHDFSPFGQGVILG